MNNNKLFVGSLPWAIDDNGLADIFSQAGKVISAQVIKDRATGRSKGFGFVEMSSDEEAQNAVKTLDGADIEGRKIVVNIARPKQS